MSNGTLSLFPKVFDASSLLSIEKAKRMPALRARRDEVVFPEKVAAEVGGRESPLRRFIKKHPGAVVTLTAQEEETFLELLREPDIDEGEAAAIAVAVRRGYPLIIDDGRARKRAVRLGVKCLGWRDFVDGRA